jgi:uncharacterized membrane protein YfcA
MAVGLAMVFAAGLVRGFSGFGLSIAAVPLLSLIMPPAQAVPIVLLLQLFVSLSGLRSAWQICDRPTMSTLALGALITTPIGAWALAHLPAAPVRGAIALVVLSAVVVLARGARFNLGHGATIPFGIASGLFNGLAGMPGPPVIAYFLASHTGNNVARASMIVFFLLTSVFALLPMAAFGLITRDSMATACIGFPLVLVGSAIGAHMFSRSPEGHYRLVALCLLIAAGALAAIRAVYSPGV